MRSLIAAEWYKLRHSTVLGVVLLGVAAIAVADALSAYFLQDSPVRGATAVSILGDQSSFLSVWIAAFVAFFVASEFQSGAIRNVLAFGKGRTAVALAKLFSVCVAVVAMLAVMGVVATVAFSAALGFGDKTWGEFLGLFIATFVLQAVYQLPQAAIFTMFALLSRSVGMTILFSIGYVIFVLALGGFLNAFPGGALKVGLRFFPQYYVSELYLTETDLLNLGPAFVLTGVAVSAIYFVVATLIAGAVFGRSDIK
jgi:ABC-2 type transport system permease protein